MEQKMDSHSRAELMAQIEKLKKEKQAVILAHYYTNPEVQQVADFTGDSLALSEQAARTDARIILFAGVQFMAETAKVLSPDKKVLVPAPDAGCSLADSCRAEDLAAWKAEHPGVMVVSYVNTSVEVKALTDICCTSSNALRIVSRIPAEQPILFLPDRNLGGYIKSVTDRESMEVWDGCCKVHEEFSAEGLAELRAAHPHAPVLAHPECKSELLAQADVIGSTAALLDYTTTSAAEEFIVVTEMGIIHEMECRSPEKRFLAAPKKGGGCNECADMKKVTLENIFTALRDESPEILLDEEVRSAAEGSIRRMLDLSK